MQFFQKDDIFTIPLPDSELVFTRYLYVKDEVIISLLVSILQKSNDAIFWAYELYHSGFKNYVFEIIWKIYYDFFATLNPTFESYLLKQHSAWLETNGTDDKIISMLVQDLLIRPFNTDIFMLRNICNTIVIDINYHSDTDKINNIIDLEKNLEKWIETEDFRSIAQWILFENNQTVNILTIYKICLNIFTNKGLKLTKNKLLKELIFIIKIDLDTNLILLAKIMSLFSKKVLKIKDNKSYITLLDDSDIVKYDTITVSDKIKHYRILEVATANICGIDDLNHLSLFKLKRSKYNLQEKYYNNWKYHAAFSPVWFNRFKEFNGLLDFNNKDVIFSDDNDAFKFHNEYGYEPDEQKTCVQNKSIIQIKKEHNWRWFLNKYKNNGMFDIYDEELDEFDVDGLLYI